MTEDDGPDGGSDGGLDGGSDAGPVEDAGTDGGSDAGQDDGGSDGGEQDAGLDSGEPDSGLWVDGGLCGPASISAPYTYASQSLGLGQSLDLDGDGLLDRRERFNVSFEIFFGRADGGLSLPVVYPETASPFIASGFGDVNGDGSPDFVGLEESGALDIWLNDGGGGLSPRAQLTVGSASPNFAAVAIADLNADGLADIILDASELEVLLGEPDAGFSAPVALPNDDLSSTWSPTLVVGDLNQDGLLDIVAVTASNLQLAVLINQGDGGFHTTVYPVPVLGEILLLPRAGGAPDILVGETGIDSDGLWSALGIELLRNAGDGTFPATGNTSTWSQAERHWRWPISTGIASPTS